MKPALMRLRAPGDTRTRCHVMAAGAAVTALLVCQPRAVAQNAPNLSLERFQPAPGPGRIMAVPTSQTMGLWSYAAELAIDYAIAPLGTAIKGPVVTHQFTGQILAGIGLGFAEVTVGFPITLSQSGDPSTTALIPNVGIAGTAAGDLRLTAKVRLFPLTGSGAKSKETAGRTLSPGALRKPAPLRGGIAVEALASFPTGGGQNFSSEGGFGFGGRLVGDIRLNRLQFAAYVGYRYRTLAAQVLNIYITDELLAGVAASVTLLPRWLDLFVNAYGSFSFHTSTVADASGQGKSTLYTPDAAERPLELLIGAQLKTPLGIEVALGGGAGIGTGGDANHAKRGYGEPDFRVVALLGFCSEYIDSDGDGMPDIEDRCVKQPGPESNFGCPTPPPEAARATPNDSDGDGIPDARDRCPDTPETAKLPHDDEGCVIVTSAPPPVSDGAPLNFVPVGPPPISETPAVAPASPLSAMPAGSPSAGPAGSTIGERVIFDVDSPGLSSKALQILELVAKQMRERADIKRLAVEGHADDSGEREANQALSSRRAETVKAFLVGRGIAPKRLESYGFGYEHPVVPRTLGPEERAVNRRVEFRIVETSASSSSKSPKQAAKPNP